MVLMTHLKCLGMIIDCPVSLACAECYCSLGFLLVYAYCRDQGCDREGGGNTGEEVRNIRTRKAAWQEEGIRGGEEKERHTGWRLEEILLWMDKPLLLLALPSVWLIPLSFSILTLVHSARLHWLAPAYTHSHTYRELTEAAPPPLQCSES